MRRGTRAGKQGVDGKGASSPLAAPMIRLEQSEMLDGAVRVVQPVVRALTANQTVRGGLQGSWAGHAVHPVLVQVPLGAWLGACLLDVARADEDAARLLVGAGLVAVVPAVATGWAEFAGADRHQKRVGVVHAAGNAVAAGLQVGSYVARRGNRRGLGMVLSGAAMTVAGAAGYLGGHMSVGRGVGTKDPAFA